MALLVGYAIYGRFVDSVFGPDPARITPAISMSDGVDFIPMPEWKVFMIQFLNIAGTGPIFGAIMGAKFGPSAYLWIVFGCIFAGSVHDYLSGMLSMRNGGAGLPELIGKYLGNKTKKVMLAFSVLLLVMVGAVFVYSPAVILRDIAGNGTSASMMFWIAMIFVYYVIATMLPIDKIIGKIYPVFAFALIFMAVALMVCLFIKWPSIPEFWDGLSNRTPSLGVSGQPVLPCLFITIACGAISGFHATQSPLMARCLKSERLGRPVFYGAMVTEGIVALVWAAVASYFFFDGGAAEVGSDIHAAAPAVVTAVSKSWLGTLGGILAMLGVVAAPVTSGDTALRGARLIVADALGKEQKSIIGRLEVCVPIFVATVLILWYNIADADGFNTIWKYFGWANQSLSIFTFWALTVFLYKERRGMRYLITMIPGMFMTAICTAYIFVDSSCLGLPASFALPVSLAAALLSFLLFMRWKTKYDKKIVS